MKLLVIAIDGPSGAGKGTLARTVAERLGYRHVDTGAMYRAVAWKSQQAGLALDDESAVAAVAEQSVIAQEGVNRHGIAVTGDFYIGDCRARNAPFVDCANGVAQAVFAQHDIGEFLVARAQEFIRDDGFVSGDEFEAGNLFGNLHIHFNDVAARTDLWVENHKGGKCVLCACVGCQRKRLQGFRGEFFADLINLIELYNCTIHNNSSNDSSNITHYWISRYTIDYLTRDYYRDDGDRHN